MRFAFALLLSEAFLLQIELRSTKRTQKNRRITKTTAREKKSGGSGLYVSLGPLT
jgi:hypothetical protein